MQLREPDWLGLLPPDPIVTRTLAGGIAHPSCRQLTGTLLTATEANHALRRSINLKSVMWLAASQE